MNRSRHRGRLLAVQALYSWDVSGTSIRDLVRFAWSEDISAEAATFPRLLVSGTVENVDTVDATIAKHLVNWTLDRLARVDLAILRVSAYCLLFQRDIPPQVTIDEAVELAKELSTPEAYRFVNGVLDGIRRALDPPADPANGEPR